MADDRPDSLTKLGHAIESIWMDYQQEQPPFSDHRGQIDQIIADFDTDREKVLFKTLVDALNYQRDAVQHWEMFGDLWYDEHWIFDPEAVVEDHSFEELESLFEEVGTRMGTRDAKIWYEISRTLYHDHDGNPIQLFEKFDYNKDRIDEYVQEASGDTRFFNGKFPYLRGDKIRPHWLRLVSSHVPLRGDESQEIPVDTHIISVTSEICGTQYTDTEDDKARIRRFWRTVCEPVDVTPVEVDIALWFIDRGWDDWGERYLRRELNEVGLELGQINCSETYW